ncbi:hypothetical protein BGW38_010711, partial [Lunasporangiospora selenospora]
MGTLGPNIESTISDQSRATLAITCIKKAVREVSRLKRQCQEVLGRYFDVLSSQETIGQEDRTFLNYLFPHGEADDVDPGDSIIEDDGPADKNKTLAFIHSLMAFLYSGNLSNKKKGTGDVVNKFIKRLQALGLLPEPGPLDYLNPPNIKEFSSSSLVRYVSKQFATALKTHWKKGYRIRSEK